MRKIMVKSNNGEIECNYTKKIEELIDGLFKDKTKPLLMEFHFMFRPTKISTKSRGEYQLPPISMMTFDKNGNLVRKFDVLPQESTIQTLFKEKYILEIPRTDNLWEKMMRMKRLEWREVK